MSKKHSRPTGRRMHSLRLARAYWRIQIYFCILLNWLSRIQVRGGTRQTSRINCLITTSITLMTRPRSKLLQLTRRTARRPNVKMSSKIWAQSLPGEVTRPLEPRHHPKRKSQSQKRRRKSVTQSMTATCILTPTTTISKALRCSR